MRKRNVSFAINLIWHLLNDKNKIVNNLLDIIKKDKLSINQRKVHDEE